MVGITSSRVSLCCRASSEGKKDPRVYKEKEKATGTNLGYSTVVLPKKSLSVPFPAKKNLQPDIALQTLAPTKPTNS